MRPIKLFREFKFSAAMIVIVGISLSLDAVRGFNFGLINSQVADFTLQARLTSDDNFASTVAISGDTAVVSSAAGARVFVRSGNIWSQQAVLVPSDGTSVFSGSPPVEIVGNTVVLGGPTATINGNTNQGAVYVFVRNGTAWTEQQRLTASDGAAGDDYGSHVAINGETILVGAPSNDVGSNLDQGSVYVYVRSGTVWTEQQILLADDGGAHNGFGFRVALEGNTGVVSRPRRSNAAAVDPAVYVFARTGTTWQQQQRLSVCEPSASDFCSFGNSVAVRGNTLAVGNSFLNSGSSTAVGGVYMFNRSGVTWTQQQKLVPPTAVSNSEYGSAIAVDLQTLVIGAEGDFGGPPGGSVYVYLRPSSDWVQQQELKVPGVTYWNSFGHTVSLSGNTMIVGTPRDNGTSPYIGAAYIYTQPAAPAARSPFDFDGDAKTDVSIFRPSGASGGAEWWIVKSGNQQTAALQFGVSTDKPVPADFTGDGKTDIAFWRPSDGQWFILRSEDFSFFAFPFGGSGDIPMPADYDGDGKADAAVFRPSSATWFILRSSDGQVTFTQFGANGDLPVAADYDGDGKADIAIYRPSGANGAEWWIQRSTNQSVFALQFGSSTDKAVPGDYTGDGKADIAFWRPSDGQWFVLRSEDFSFFAFPWGGQGDIPAPGDYDGDGKTDAAVFRPNAQTWFINRSSQGPQFTGFGLATDQPVPGAYVR